MSQPSMTTDFFIAGGTLRPNTPSYVKRPADDELFKRALAGEFCYVLTTRQMGKSSLMVRTARRLQAQGVRTAIIDLTEIGTVSVEAWYLDLIIELARTLRLAVDAEAWWQERAAQGHVQRFMSFLRDVVLAEVEAQVVIFIDEIDTTLSLDFTDDFFAVIRAAYNNRAKDATFDRLNFVLLGVASPSDLIKDRTRTPFNIGRGILLQDFKRADATILQDGLEAAKPGQGEAIFDRIYYWTSGHPYLTQKLCQVIVGTEDEIWTDKKIDQVVEREFLTEEASKESNLEFVREKILTHPQHRQLLIIYRQVYVGKSVADNQQSLQQNQLKLSGLVKAEDGRLQVRNEIYRRIFGLAWVKANTAINWAPILAGVAVFIVLLVVGFLIHNSWVKNKVAKAELQFYQAKSPETKIESLATILEPPGLYQVSDYDNKAKDLFFNLSTEEQVALFAVDSVEGEKVIVVVVIQGLYTALADTDDSDSTHPVLRAMATALEKLEETPETKRLKSEIQNWLRGRDLAKQGKHEDAFSAYDGAIKSVIDKSPAKKNPAILYERAKVLVELGRYREALEDLNDVMAIAGQQLAPALSANAILATLSSLLTDASTITSSATPIGVSTSTSVSTPDTSSPEIPATPTPTPQFSKITSAFKTISDIRTAASKLIDDNPNLVRELVNNPSAYPSLEGFGLVVGNILLNSSFEMDEGWIFRPTVKPGGYTNALAHTGSRSVLIGITDANVDEITLSSVAQKVTIPADAQKVTLTAFVYPVSQDPSSRDLQITSVLNQNFREVEQLSNQLSNAQTWQQQTFDLTKYKGKTIYVYFGVVNSTTNGKVTALYVDDVSLVIQK